MRADPGKLQTHEGTWHSRHIGSKLKQSADQRLFLDFFRRKELARGGREGSAKISAAERNFGDVRDREANPLYQLPRGRVATSFPPSIKRNPQIAVAVDRGPVGMTVGMIDSGERPGIAKRAVLADIGNVDRAFQRVHKIEQLAIG